MRMSFTILPAPGQVPGMQLPATILETTDCKTTGVISRHGDDPSYNISQRARPASVG